MFVKNVVKSERKENVGKSNVYIYNNRYRLEENIHERSVIRWVRAATEGGFAPVSSPMDL